jgi:hypothetical protein
MHFTAASEAVDLRERFKPRAPDPPSRFFRNIEAVPGFTLIGARHVALILNVADMDIGGVDVAVGVRLSGPAAPGARCRRERIGSSRITGLSRAEQRQGQPDSSKLHPSKKDPTKLHEQLENRHTHFGWICPRHIDCGGPWHVCLRATGNHRQTFGSGG